jgi:hypothetical protein
MDYGRDRPSLAKKGRYESGPNDRFTPNSGHSSNIAVNDR